MKRVVLLAALALSAVGCFPATYSSISRNADGTYLLTINKNGVFTVYGVVYHCTAAGDELRCTKVGEPG
jgi:hypothetical protein